MDTFEVRYYRHVSDVQQKLLSNQPERLSAADLNNIRKMVDEYGQAFLSISNEEIVKLFDFLAAVKAKFPSFQLARDSQEILKKAYKMFTPDGRPELFAEMVHQLSSLDFSWSDIARNHNKRKFYMDVQNSVEKVSPEALAQLTYAMGRSGAKSSELPSHLKRALWARLTEAMPAMAAESVGRCLQGLAMMGMWWSGLPVELRQAACDALRDKTFAAPEAAEALWALGSMGQTLQNMPTYLLEKLVLGASFVERSQLSSATLRSFARCLYGVARLRLRWRDASKRLRFVLADMIKQILLRSADASVFPSISLCLW